MAETSDLSSARGPAATTRASRLASRVPWLVWGALLVALLVCVVVYGVNLPYHDDWETVPALTGNEPHFFSWLWAQWSEHRVPIPRLIQFALLKATGGDFRAGMALNILVVAAVTAAMMLTASRIRGRASVTDALFPLAMLHLGHWTNLLWSWGIQYVSSVALTIVLLVIIVRQSGPLSPRSAALAAASFLLLPLTGATGLAMAAALAPWVLASAWIGSRMRRAGEPAWASAILWIAALGAALEAVAYFVGLVPEPWSPERPSLGFTLRTAGMILAYGFGPMAAHGWELSMIGAAALLVPSGALALVAVVREGGAARARAIGMFVFGAGLATLALAIAWGRATFGIHYRYVLLSAPALCWAYLLWELYGRPAPRRAIQWAMFLALAALLPFNSYWYGFFVGDWSVTQERAVLRDIDAGLSPEAIADRHGQYLMHWDTRQLGERIEMLRRARIAPWSRMAAPNKQ